MRWGSRSVVDCADPGPLAEFYRGYALQMSGRVRDAIVAYEAAQAGLPDSDVVLNNLGYAQLVVPGADNTPKVGEPAPEFELPVSLGSQQTLGKKDFAGKKKVLLAFYPADFTGG